jgi:hypothetical protein
VDAATPVDAQNAPTGVWKSRNEREIPTASTSIIFFSEEQEERRTKPLRSTVHKNGSPPKGSHAVYVSQPKVVATLIAKAATSVAFATQ